MTHMDAYTILFQAKERMIEEDGLYRLLENQGAGDVSQVIEQIIQDETAIKELATKGIEEGINKIRSEFPPNVSKRMNKYYRVHKETLVANFCPRIQEAMQTYYKPVK